MTGTGVPVTYKRFDEENEDRFELPGYAGYATATDRGRHVWLLEIWVDPDHRGRRHATALLEAVTARYATRELALSADPFMLPDHDRPGLSAGQLAAWYARHGFERDSGNRMTRLPGAVPGSLSAPVTPGADQAAAGETAAEAHGPAPRNTARPGAGRQVPVRARGRHR